MHKPTLYGISVIVAVFLILFLAPKVTVAQDDEELLAEGKKIFESKIWGCATCHAKDGSGTKEFAPPLNTKEVKAKLTDDKIKEQILNGKKVDKKKWKKDMPAFKDKLKEKQVKALIQYVKTFFPKG